MTQVSCAQKTILICDDAHDIVDLMSYILSNAGYAVRTASGHEEFNQRMSECAPDVIILDIQMPERNGFWIAEDLQIKGGNIPIIFITAYNKPLYRLYASALGGTDFVLKPVDPYTLLQKVEKALQRPLGGNGFLSAT